MTVLVTGGCGYIGAHVVKSAWDAWQANPEHHIDVATWKQVG